MFTWCFGKLSIVSYNMATYPISHNLKTSMGKNEMPAMIDRCQNTWINCLPSVLNSAVCKILSEPSHIVFSKWHLTVQGQVLYWNIFSNSTVAVDQSRWLLSSLLRWSNMPLQITNLFHQRQKKEMLLLGINFFIHIYWYIWLFVKSLKKVIHFWVVWVD